MTENIIDKNPQESNNVSDLRNTVIHSDCGWSQQLSADMIELAAYTPQRIKELFCKRCSRSSKPDYWLWPESGYPISHELGRYKKPRQDDIDSEPAKVITAYHVQFVTDVSHNITESINILKLGKEIERLVKENGENMASISITRVVS